MSAFQIQRWLDSGHLHRLHRGVYAVGYRRTAREGLWLAAVLACGEGAFLSHGPAGQLQGIVPRRERFALHVSLRGRRDRSPAGIVTHRPRNLETCDTRLLDGIPVTTATRTVWDLATVLTPTGTRRAFEEAVRLGSLDRDRLWSLADTSPNRRGAGTIRALLAEGTLPLERTRSWLEDLFARMGRDNALPLPLVNEVVLGYEVDFLWPDARLVVEADGGGHMLPSRRDKDNERDSALQRAGYFIRRYGERAMSRGDAVAGEVRAILTERLSR